MVLVQVVRRKKRAVLATCCVLVHTLLADSLVIRYSLNKFVVIVVVLQVLKLLVGVLVVVAAHRIFCRSQLVGEGPEEKV